jgi:hypothetical protein
MDDKIQISWHLSHYRWARLQLLWWFGPSYHWLSKIGGNPEQASVQHWTARLPCQQCCWLLAPSVVYNRRARLAMYCESTCTALVGMVFSLVSSRNLPSSVTTCLSCTMYHQLAVFTHFKVWEKLVIIFTCIVQVLKCVVQTASFAVTSYGTVWGLSHGAQNVVKVALIL